MPHDPTEVTDFELHFCDGAPPRCAIQLLGEARSQAAQSAGRGVLSSCDFSEQTNQAQSGEGDPDPYRVGYPGEPSDPEHIRIKAKAVYV